MAPLFNLVVCIGSRVWLTCASWRNQRHLAYLLISELLRLCFQIGMFYELFRLCMTLGEVSKSNRINSYAYHSLILLILQIIILYLY